MVADVLHVMLEARTSADTVKKILVIMISAPESWEWLTH